MGRFNVTEALPPFPIQHSTFTLILHIRCND